MEPKNEGKSAEISIYDEIGGWGVTAQDFMDSLDALGEVESIDLRISSPGGSIIEGNVIFNAIKRHAASVTVYIDGMAASMASVIAMAGDEIVMAENALLMIHNPWTVSIGDSEQLRKDADLMDKMKSAIINAYGRANYDAEELETLMNETTWFTAKEALESGFIDKIDGALEMAASLTDLEAIASKVGATLPVEKIVASLKTKHKETLDLLNAELDSNSNQLSANAVLISDLQNENESHKAKIVEMEASHTTALQVTEQAVADKAAELMAMQTQTPVADSDDDLEDGIKDADSFWAEYRRIEKAEGHEAKNKFYAENKHILKK